MKTSMRFLQTKGALSPANPEMGLHGQTCMADNSAFQELCHFAGHNLAILLQAAKT